MGMAEVAPGGPANPRTQPCAPPRVPMGLSTLQGTKLEPPPSHVERPRVHLGRAWCHHRGLWGWRGRESPCTGQQALAGALLS